LTQSPIYELIYINSCLGAIRNISGNFGLDGLFLYIGHVLVINLQDIQVQIKTKIANKKQLVDLVEYHGKLIEAFKVFREIYFPILIAQFFLIASQICVLGYQFTMVFGVRMNELGF
jgi:hypothetical protein